MGKRRKKKEKQQKKRKMLEHCENARFGELYNCLMAWVFPVFSVTRQVILVECTVLLLKCSFFCSILL